MNTNKETIDVVWLKRDLRLDDNEAISNALASENRVLFVYIFEDSQKRQALRCASLELYQTIDRKYKRPIKKTQLTGVSGKF